jgi:signal transduction histidine kinase
MATVANVERTLSMSLTVEPSGLGAIRRDIACRLGGWGLSAIADDVVSVVVELLTNVFEHADGVCELEIEPVADRVVVSVSDTVIAIPTMQPPQPPQRKAAGCSWWTR